MQSFEWHIKLRSWLTAVIKDPIVLITNSRGFSGALAKKSCEYNSLCLAPHSVIYILDILDVVLLKMCGLELGGQRAASLVITQHSCIKNKCQRKHKTQIKCIACLTYSKTTFKHYILIANKSHEKTKSNNVLVCLSASCTFIPAEVVNLEKWVMNILSFSFFKV